MNKADRQAWQWCRTLADLGEMTARWLEGKVDGQPAYAYPDPGEPGGPDEETGPLVPVLAAANRAGYLTDCSQPGEACTGWDGAWWEQRAAVSGFASDADAVRLADMASACGLIVVVRQSTRWLSRFRHLVPVTARSGWAYTRFGAVLSRRHLTDDWVGYGECHPDAVRAVCGAWQVSIIDPEWGRSDSPVWTVLAEFASLGVTAS